MKFTSIILALLLAPSVAVADLPANGSGSDAAAVGVGVGRRLGGKSAKSGSNGSAIKLSEEEAEANSNANEAEVSAMAMGGGDKKKSCAASRPAVAIEQVAIAFFLAEMGLVGLKGSFPPSIAAFIESNYDPSIDPDIDDDEYQAVFFLINRVLSEMSCEEYIKGQETSVFMKLILSTGQGPSPFGPWLKLKEELSGTAAFGEIVANLGN